MNHFWDYSLRLYPEIEPWCLTQQDCHDANVNLLLFGCFVGSQGRQLDDRHWQQLQSLIGSWDGSVVKPLRQLRRQMKQQSLPGDAEPVRQRIKQAELAAEQQLQELLFEWWQSHSGDLVEVPATTVVQQNLIGYLRLQGVTEPPPTAVVNAALAAM